MKFTITDEDLKKMGFENSIGWFRKLWGLCEHYPRCQDENRGLCSCKFDIQEEK